MNGTQYASLILVAGMVLLLAGPVAAGSSDQPSGATAQGTAPSLDPERPGYRPQELIVRYKETAVRNGSVILSSQEHFLSTLKAMKTGLSSPKVADDMGKSGNPGLQLILLPDNLTVEEALSTAGQNPDIAYAQPNYRVTPCRNLPNDPEFYAQWYLYNKGDTVSSLMGTYRADIHAPEAWDYTTGSRKVIIGVMDMTGVDITVPDLYPNIWKNTREKQNNGIDDDKNGYVDDKFGWNFVDEDGDHIVKTGEGNPDVLPDPDEEASDHGTDCARLIGSVGNNDLDLAGVMWQVSILPLKFDGYSWTEVKAIEYAKQAGARVISCSYGSYHESPAEEEAMAKAPDILFVCSAGNDGIDTDKVPHYPSSFDLPNVISVGATDQNDKYTTSWSNVGRGSNFGKESVDLAAPGGFVLIKGTKPSYSYIDGTSFSAPLVAGTAGLVLSINPSLSAEEVKSVLMATVDVLGGHKGLTVTEGRLNAGNAVKMVKTGAKVTPKATTQGPTPTPTPTRTPTKKPTPTKTVKPTTRTSR